MSPFLAHDTKFKCPYEGCGKTFDRPETVIDSSILPRQTHYACPHCMSKIEVIADNVRIIGVRPTEYPRVFDSPAKCAYFSSSLSVFSKDAPLPDECLACPKVLQCKIRKR